jgi:hypothetical protein
MKAWVRKQRDSGLWLVVGTSSVDGAAIAYSLFRSWSEAIDWAAGVEPRPQPLTKLRAVR